MFVVLVVRVSHGHAFDIIMVIYVLSIIATSFCSYVRPETVRDANYEDETLYSTMHFYSAVFKFSDGYQCNLYFKVFPSQYICNSPPYDRKNNCPGITPC